MPRSSRRIRQDRAAHLATALDLARAQAELEVVAAQARINEQYRAATEATQAAAQQRHQTDTQNQDDDSLEVDDDATTQGQGDQQDEDEELDDDEENSHVVEDSQMRHSDVMMDGKDDEESLANLKEIGNLASWTVSTAKPGCGIAALRDEDTELYWQSDGPQPHSINIHFAKRVFVKRIRIYLDYLADESYTPTKISILSGTGYHNLQEVTSMAFDQPHGWIDVDLGGVHEDGMLRTFLIQVGIHANHQNGKDTHVRGLQIFSPAKLLDSSHKQLEQRPVVPTEKMGELGLGADESDQQEPGALGTYTTSGGEKSYEILFTTSAMYSEFEIR